MDKITEGNRVIIKLTNKEHFISDYIKKRMDKHVFPKGMSMEWYSALNKYEDAAEIAWERKVKKKLIQDSKQWGDA